jgi:hypothetical protein
VARKIQFSVKKDALMVLLAVSAVVSGCTGGNGDGLDISGRPLQEGGDVVLAPTLESIQANIFDPSCTVCHAGASAPQGLKLDAANSFINLVGVPSNEVSLLRVSPGDPDQSYLIRKLEGSASVGGQMPLGGPPIPQATIDFVRQWISDGAMAAAVAISKGMRPAVVTISPDPDSTINQLPDRITAGFNLDIDASTINFATFQIIRSGGDNNFGNGNEETIAVTSVGLSTINPRLAMLDLRGIASVDDRYRIILKGIGPSVILSNDGVAIDGDYIAEFQLVGVNR